MPIPWDDVLAARRRLAQHLPVTPLRRYASLDEAVGLRVLVKHDNHLPTNAFKVRNAVSFMTALPAEQRVRGVIAASRGNHGAGLAWAGERLGIPVVVCVPHGNNPEKNAAIRGFGAELVESGRDYDESIAVATRIARDRGLVMAHSTNDPHILAGAATLSAELCEQAAEIAAPAASVTGASGIGAAGNSAAGVSSAQGAHGTPSAAGALDAIVVSVGGGSQAVGALLATAALRPGVAVYGVQARGASAIHDSWHAGARLTTPIADTFADGLATRATYDLTWEPLRRLAGFVVVSDAEIADAIRLLWRTTHNLAEGAGAAGLAGLRLLRDRLGPRATVAIVMSGSNLDAAMARRVFAGEL